MSSGRRCRDEPSYVHCVTHAGLVERTLCTPFARLIPSYYRLLKAFLPMRTARPEDTYVQSDNLIL